MLAGSSYDLLLMGLPCTKIFQLTPGPTSSRRIRTRPVLSHLICVFCGVVAFVATKLYLIAATDDLQIFSEDKRYLGAALCLIASVNAYWFAYQLAKKIVLVSGLISKHDVAALSPLIAFWPDEWNFNVESENSPKVICKGD